MRIKKLELSGFKSFKDRTVIHFDEGITGIVGPNGCGKSNIVDALVWVMGEMSAKHLRGSSMSDVIFAGAEGYAPMGLAEVSLTLENDGGPFPAKYLRHSEIMVTRRLHRSGETEYLINKESARLRDIQEIFMDTGAGSKGFSIVEQGMIGKIVTAKPEERRTLIEEAAGITKFKVRKRESQRKLTATDQNLVRLQDIIGEQKRQLDSLQRQAQRAERYRKIKDELQDKELWVSSSQFLGMSEETQEAEQIFTEAKESEASCSSDISQMESDLEQAKLTLSEKETAVNDHQVTQQESQKAVTDKENAIREFGFEIEQARRNKEMTGNILGQYEVRGEALKKDQTDLAEKLVGVEEESKRLASEFEDKNSKFQGVQTRIQEADESLTNKRREMLTVSQSESHMEARLSSLEEQMVSSEERLATSRSVLSELDEKRVEFEARHKKFTGTVEEERQMQLNIMGDVENFQENLTALQADKKKREKELEEYKEQLNEVTGKLYGLENLQANFEGFQEGVKNVMMWQRERVEHAGGGSSVEFRPVAEVVEVPQDYEMAMEAALGNRLQMLLSDSQETCLSAVDYLKDNSSGRSSFMSADLASNSGDEGRANQLKAEQGFAALLQDVVSVPSQYQKQVAHFLTDVVIVDNIRTALRMRPSYPGMTFVTCDGDTLTADGVLTGGSSEGADSGVLKRRREIKELSQRREELSGKLSLAQLSLDKVNKQVETMEQELENAEKLYSEKEILLTSLKKDLERAENELRNAEQACTRQQDEVSKLEAQHQASIESKENLEESIRDIKEKKLTLEAEVAALDDELRSSRQGIDSLQEAVSELRVQSASKRQELEGLLSQKDMVDKSLAEVEGQLQEMSEESEKSSESLTSNQVLIEQAKVEMESLIHKAQEAEKHLAELRDDYEQTSTKTRELEQNVSSSLHSINEHKTRMNDAQLKLEQLKMKEQYLVDQIHERYMLDLREEAPKFVDREGDIKQAEKELEDLRGKIKRIGEVNLSAIEEYDDLSSRYEFLSKQHEDLLEAKEQLRKVIDRINRICSRRFKETFEQVNSRFTKVFPVMFGGGEARLILVEDEEKGEMGIDIVSRPPGKKMQNVSLLSGGEKALTAVALIFSIFLVKPSPYCLLDEVDAPLDDANVYRFNDLVREMAKRSQIIVVTHNKHTMKINDKLYGVTMEEKGVSKMVSVSLDDAEKVAEV